MLEGYLNVLNQIIRQGSKVVMSMLTSYIFPKTGKSENKTKMYSLKVLFSHFSERLGKRSVRNLPGLATGCMTTRQSECVKIMIMVTKNNDDDCTVYNINHLSSVYMINTQNRCKKCD